MDNQHNKTVMFYNGANAQAHWRIGWVEMDEHGKITDRSVEPLITPPASKPGEVNIAFLRQLFWQEMKYGCIILPKMTSLSGQ